MRFFRTEFVVNSLNIKNFIQNCIQNFLTHNYLINITSIKWGTLVAMYTDLLDWALQPAYSLGAELDLSATGNRGISHLLKLPSAGWLT